jgi:beta-galactosidase
MLRQPLPDNWQFARLSDGDLDQLSLKDTAAACFESVSLPHTLALEGRPWKGNAVYRRCVQTGEGWRNVFLEFEAVDQCCRVLIDGTDVGSHRGGYSRFRVQVPAEALKKPAFVVDVFVSDTVSEHVSPHFGDFTVYGGIPRPVSLLVCGDTHFDYLYFGTDGLILHTDVDESGAGILTAEPHVVNASGAMLALTVRDGAGCVAASAVTPADEPVRLSVPHVRLWDGRRDPALCTVEAVLTVDGQEADRVELTTGFRRIEADGSGLRLNGSPCFLRGVARHQDRAEALTAATAAQIAEDFDLIDGIGANAVRLSHYQHPQAAYDECDRRGILCWAEIPMLKMTEDEALQENALQQLTELILQNIHHPSVWCWGIQNEIAMFRDAPFMHDRCRELNALAKRLDPGRLTACANLYPVPPESGLNGITDIVGYNYYFGWYYGEFSDYGKYLDAFHAARPGVTVGISEYGADANLRLHSADPKVKDYSEEYQALYHESVYPWLKARPWMWGSFVWNMFDFSSDRRDEGGTKGINAKGLVTWDRKTRKDAYYYYKAQWSSEPFLHICGKRYAVRAGDTAAVKIYTGCPEAELTVNGQSVGTRRNSGNGVILFENVPLRMGKNTLTAACGDVRDEAELTRADAEPEEYRLPDDGQGGNVLNWFLQGEQKADCFSILNTAQQVMENPAARNVIREALPELFGILEAGTVIPMGLTMKSILSRNMKDPEQIQRINKALQEIRLEETSDRRE